MFIGKQKRTAVAVAVVAHARALLNEQTA